MEGCESRMKSLLFSRLNKLSKLMMSTTLITFCHVPTQMKYNNKRESFPICTLNSTTYYIQLTLKSLTKLIWKQQISTFVAFAILHRKFSSSTIALSCKFLEGTEIIVFTKWNNKLRQIKAVDIFSITPEKRLLVSSMK